jgi:hypothetical protein
MKTYVSHKEVKAAKILHLYKSGDAIQLELEGEKVNVLVTREYLLHKPVPEVGMYYVEYEDGYFSFSPAATFEAGYKEKI